MRTPQQLLDGLGFAANTAIGLGRGLKDEIQSLIDAKVQQKLNRLNFVSREEFEELQTMVTKIRSEQENNQTDMKNNDEIDQK